jgi:multimeric flavodoxin WrbA
VSAQNRRPRVLVLNGALGGKGGNTASMLERTIKILRPHADVDVVTLVDEPDVSIILPRFDAADAFLLATGVYWDSWGSPLQRFFEEATASEGTELWMGKPAAVIVTMHAVGGKAVLSRLMGVLNSFGAYVPPMSGMVYSLANQLSSRPGNGAELEDLMDLWCEEDLDVVCHNLVEAIQGTRRWKAWEVDRQDPRRQWMPWPTTDPAEPMS